MTNRRLTIPTPYLDEITTVWNACSWTLFVFDPLHTETFQK